MLTEKCIRKKSAKDLGRIIANYLPKKLTKEMADYIGVHYVTVCKWKSGKAVPKKENAQKIRKYLIDNIDVLNEGQKCLETVSDSKSMTHDTYASVEQIIEENIKTEKDVSKQVDMYLKFMQGQYYKSLVERGIKYEKR